MPIERVECRNRTSCAVVDMIFCAPLDIKWVYHTNLCIRGDLIARNSVRFICFDVGALCCAALKLMQIAIYTMAMMSDKQTYTLI